MRKREKRDELLLLTAVSGEIPADWIGEAAGSKDYGAALLTRLKKEGEIKLRSKDGIRGYLLRAKGKRYLLEMYGEDVERFLSGSGAANHVKSEPEKRLRLHRMSMVWVYFYRMGIAVFASDKPVMFPGLYPSPCKRTGNHKGTLSRKSNGEDGLERNGVDKGERELEDRGETVPMRVNKVSNRDEPGGNGRPGIGAYYGTVEWKLETDKEISGSRACGILVGNQAFMVYNTMDSLMKWTPKIERNLKSRMEIRFRRFGETKVCGAVMMGIHMDMLKRILDSDGGVKGNLYQVDETYDHIYYVPFVKEAAVQVRLLCSTQGRERLRTFLCGVLSRIRENPFGLEAGTDQNGRKVYFCYLLDLWQLKRIRGQSASQGGRVFCFTYQAQIIHEIFGERFEVEAIRPEKVYKYLGWSEP